MDKITTFLFDLDGTLLPMDNDGFVEIYFGELAKRMAKFGFEPKKLISNIWAGTKAMIMNDGSRSGEEVFWEYFKSVYGEEGMKYIPEFDDFYTKEFELAKKATNPNPFADKCVKLLKAKGYEVALATNPIFPRVATMARIKWAGLDAEDYSLITTYENIGLCKPNPEYYREILRRLDKTPDECVMVGNDCTEDMQAAEAAGIKTILIPECLIAKDPADADKYTKMSFEELYEYISAE